MRSMGSCSIHFEDAFVADEDVLGAPNKAWYMLLPTLNNERIMVGSFCLGVIDGILEDALEYMKQRHAFGKPIGQFQALQHYVADIATMQTRSEEHTSELQSLMRISYAVFCLKKNKT